VAHIGVRGEHLRVREASVQPSGKGEPVVPEHVAEHQRRSARHTATEIVGGISDLRTANVLRRKAALVLVVLEVCRIGQRERRAVEQGGNSRRRTPAGRGRNLGRRANDRTASIERLPARQRILHRGQASDGARGRRYRDCQRRGGVRRGWGRDRGDRVRDDPW
jgi:hypothetical protein